MTDMPKMKLGLQMYTMRPHTRTAPDTEETLRRVAAMGYGAVQVQPDCCALKLSECGALARELGLAVCATHVSDRWILNDTDAVIRAHKDLGCDIVGIGEMPEQYWGSAEGFARFAREFRPAARELASAGLRLIYHNHHFEFIRYGGKVGMDILLEEFDPAMCIELDTYWAQAGGADPAAWVKKLAGRLPIVHFKDMALDERWKQVYAPVGEGNLNWPGIVAACREAQVEWCVVEQDECARSAFECVETSLRYLREMGVGE